MQLYDLPNHRQLVERLVSNGADALNETELLSILLTTNEGAEKALDHAKQLLKENTLAQLLRLSVAELVALPGITLTTASLWVATRSLCELRQVQSESMNITQPSKVAAMMTALTTYSQEHVVALYVNARYTLLEQKTISIGTVNSAEIHPREVFAPAIVSRACGIILVHNHPSGDPHPSAEDIQVTRNLVEMGKLLEIPLIDHVIVAKQGWKSLKESQPIWE
ncbi:MAG: DNA repair protein RadC [Candidatus Woesebacteria bacterium]